MRKESIGVIVLAAGSSSRMGKPKQLLLIDGDPLLLRTIKTLQETKLEKIVVVLGAHRNETEKAISYVGVHTVFNDLWESGIASSVNSGLDFLLSSFPDINGVLILVCDQPLLTKLHIENLIQASSPIVASRYSNTIGVPALFSKLFFPELLDLHDDQGAKKIIERNSDRVTAVDFPFGEIDLDTPEDYNTFLKNNRK
jgi:molybdenum cofactor cytidylyltransferase